MWSAPVVVTPPVAEPLALAAAKEFARVDGSAFDTEISSYIAGARDSIEAMTSTRLITQAVEVRADSFADLDRLPVGPVQAVSEIRYLDSAGAEQLLDQATYELVGSDLDCGIRPSVGANWPSAAVREGAIAVQLTVGYGDDAAALPGDLNLALLYTVRGLFDDKPVDVERWLVNRRIYA
jgi:uncharacterized phiE125 gp8 family phage protein